MPPADSPVDLTARVKTMRIIVIAQLVIAAGYLGYAVLQRMNLEKPTPEPTPYLTYAALGVAVVLLIGHFILPAMFVEARRRKRALETARVPTDSASDIRWLCNLYLMRLIIATGLLEIAILLVTTAFLQEGYLKDYWDWGAPLFFMAVMGWEFPFVESLQKWLEEQRRLLAQERQAAAAV
jgi:hypothetical protein